MSLKRIFEKIDLLMAELQRRKPLKPKDEERLWKKFRLDWNYNSNHMEGNTLTYGHTELLLLFDKVTGDYSGREIEEMKAHDVAIRMIVEMANDKERDLTEHFIRQLNEKILVRSFWKEAITSDGQPTRREISPGEYKKFPNSVRLENGEIFHYASPEETAGQMNDLINFYKNKSNEDIHFVWLAAMLHYKFVRIHPFDDGNGRVARLLMNYVLMKNNYPPCIIKDTDKKNYILALNKADIGDLDAFVFYISEQLIWSINKSMDASQGKDIDDLVDWEKKVAILKNTIEKNSGKVIPISGVIIKNVWQSYINPLFDNILNKSQKFDDLFAGKKLMKSIDNNGWSDKNKEEMEEILRNKNYMISFLALQYHLCGYKHDNYNTFNVVGQCEIQFHEFKYFIQISNNQNNILEKLYSENVSVEEIEKIANEFATTIYNFIEKNVQRN